MHVARRLRLASSCSLLLLCGFAAAQPDYAKLERELRQNPDRLRAMVGAIANREDVDKELVEVAEEIIDEGTFTGDEASWFADEFKARSTVQLPPTDSDSAKAKAAEIKKSVLYRDTTQEQGNWLGKAFRRVFEWIQSLFPKTAPSGRLPNFGGGQWIIMAAWALLALLAAVFLFLAIRSFRRIKLAKRKRSAVLDEDEPERTLDEWLEMAGRLRAEARYREAVRCLYVACLLRYEELGVAPFRRHETNWEHLARIKLSPKQTGLDFEPPTKAFDLVWYGNRVRGTIDVDEMEDFYRQLAAFKEVAAA